MRAIEFLVWIPLPIFGMVSVYLPVQPCLAGAWLFISVGGGEFCIPLLRGSLVA
ncbi:hypothetical protein LMG33818_000708 [Halomonadaceae bacterium LMG 33818]